MALLALHAAASSAAGNASDALYSCDEGATVQPITLQAAVADAYRSNPQLLAIRQDLERSNATALAATTPFLPSATAGLQTERFVSYAPNSAPVAVGSSIVGGQRSVYTAYPTAGINWNLFNGGRDIAGYRNASAGVRAARADVEDRTITSLTAVFASYSDLLRLQLSTDNQRGIIDLLRRILAETEARYRSGRENLLAVDQIRLTLAQNERGYYDACKALSEKSSAVAAAVGLRIGTAHLLHAVTADFPDAVDISEKDLQGVVDRDPAVVAAAERIEAARNRIEQARGGFLPTVTAIVRYDWLGQSPESFGSAYSGVDRNSFRAGISIQQVLGPFTSEIAALQTARADYAKAQAAYEAALIDADGRLRTAWNARRQARLALEAATRSAENARETLRLTEQLYGAGRVTQDAVDQSRIVAGREANSVEEWTFDYRLQGWLLYRAMYPEAFAQTVLERFVERERSP